MSTKNSVEDLQSFLDTKGYDVYCYSWGDELESVLVTSTNGIVERLISGNVGSRLLTSFVNILVRSQDISNALDTAKEIFEILETENVSGYISNRPKYNEPKFGWSESIENGMLHYFKIDLNMQYTESNN
jgi:hypothetical protein